jgi:acetylornithine deacetylase/succinyl-diaminopimelate desuccinylase-like protein
MGRSLPFPDERTNHIDDQEASMSAPSAPLQYARSHQSEFVASLKELIRIPSVSTAAERQADMRKAAAWLADKLTSIGLGNVSILETGGHPVVYADWLKAGAKAPTLLVYGHYDVQPEDPVELWKTPPFEPSPVGDNLYARGASDMKGQILAHAFALESMLRTSGLPVNLKYLLEGEEEIGSPNLDAFILKNKKRLSCDLCLNPDLSIIAPDVPSITYGLRGLGYFEIRLTGAKSDLHSGTFGGAVANPALVLAKLLAGMMDDQGRITLPGFYDDVRSLKPEERESLARLPQTEAWWKEQTGVPALAGEDGYTSTERATARPTLDVNGMISGFTGEGSKTVLPAKAMAKVSMRLVPDQTPEAVERSLRAYLEANVPPTVTWEVQEHAGAKPAIVSLDSPAVRAAARALEAVWGKPPLYARQGGTVPVTATIHEVLGVDSLLMGFGLPDDNLHAPNEKLHLPTFFKAIEAFIQFTYEWASA